MTEATLNANNYIEICSMPSKFHMCMYERMKNIYAQNQSSIHCPCVWKAVYNRTFCIILVFELLIFSLLPSLYNFIPNFHKPVINLLQNVMQFFGYRY